MMKHLICRVCINKVHIQDKSYNIFEKHEDVLTPRMSLDDIVIADKLAACADVKIMKDDGLPTHICLCCLLQLEDAYYFRRKCQKSDEFLRTMSKVNTDTESSEVIVKQESEHESDDDFSEDDSTPLQISNNELKLEESPDIEPEDTCEQQPEIKPIGEEAKNYNYMIKKSRKLNLKCCDCSLTFKSKCKLSVHRKAAHLPITCQSCKLQFKSFQTYDNHQRNRPKICVNLSKLRVERIGISRQAYCKQCEFSSKNLNSAIEHLVVHTKQLKFKCDECDKSYSRVATLRGHKERTHKHYYGQKTCHICGKFFLGFTLYDSHMRLHREKNKSLHCNICKKTFTALANLHTHMKLHSDLKSFACDKCPAKFKTSAGLYSHRRKHSVRIACKVCGYSVKNPYKIRTHENEHDHSNVACKTCGKFFYSDSELELHMKLHKDRQHSCDYCEKTYNARKNLTEHLRKMHRIYVSTSEYKAGKGIKKRSKTPDAS